MFRRLCPIIVTLFVLIPLSCAHLEREYVSITYTENNDVTGNTAIPTSITVNDFVDGREEKGRVGRDYSRGLDILAKEPVIIGVPEVVGKVLEKKGYDVIRISVEGDPESYAQKFTQRFHLAGKIEDLFVRVKREGVLATFTTRGRIYFTLSNGEGTVVWAGRMRGETTVSSPFASRKGIEESLNGCIRIISDELASDEKFAHVLSSR